MTDFDINNRPAETSVVDFYKFLPTYFPTRDPPIKDTDLKFDLEYDPDVSQKESIVLTLNNVVSGILGPPGTGKSQTITALLSKYIPDTETKKKGLNCSFIIPCSPCIN